MPGRRRLPCVHQVSIICHTRLYTKYILYPTEYGIYILYPIRCTPDSNSICFPQGSLESGEETDSTCTTTASRRFDIVWVSYIGGHQQPQAFI